MRTPAAVVIYLAAIVAANLAAATFGPGITPVSAFLLIGLDLTLRDRLHDRWEGPALPLRMGLLILAGGVISWGINRDAGAIAVGSTVAFVVASSLDAAVYEFLRAHPRMVRVNGSNVVGAAADSIIFPLVAFGALLPWVILGQFVAKVAGGFVWSLILAVPVRGHSARATRDDYAADGEPGA